MKNHISKRKIIVFSFVIILGLCLLTTLLFFSSFLNNIQIPSPPKSFTSQIESIFYIFILLIGFGGIALVAGIISKKSQKN